MLDGEHDNVVRVFSADTEAGIPVIRMEYLADGSIADRYAGDPVAVADALHVLEEACRGVETQHARGVLHRDLKPANLLIAEGGRIKVSDFGLACEAGNSAGAPPFGYTEHLPPEALAGSGAIETAQGDVYALGVTLYRLLNGDGMMRAVAAPGTDVRGIGHLRNSLARSAASRTLVQGGMPRPALIRAKPTRPAPRPGRRRSPRGHRRAGARTRTTAGCGCPRRTGSGPVRPQPRGHPRLAVHSQLLSCSASEVHAMVEGAMRHGTDMTIESNYVDSHGTLGPLRGEVRL